MRPVEVLDGVGPGALAESLALLRAAAKVRQMPGESRHVALVEQESVIAVPYDVGNSRHAAADDCRARRERLEQSVRESVHVAVRTVNGRNRHRIGGRVVVGHAGVGYGANEMNPVGDVVLSNRQTAAVNELVTALQMARSHAITRGQGRDVYTGANPTAVVCPSARASRRVAS